MQLFISYLDLLNVREERQRILTEKCNFECKCERCETEMNQVSTLVVLDQLLWSQQSQYMYNLIYRTLHIRLCMQHYVSSQQCSLTMHSNKWVFTSIQLMCQKKRSIRLLQKENNPYKKLKNIERREVCICAIVSLVCHLLWCFLTRMV